MHWSASLPLVLALTRREIEQRYKGSFGGLAWYVVQTLLAVAIYSFVFGTIFSARWAEQGREPTSFTMALFLGLLFFNMFSECISRAPLLMISNVNYVKKIVFPLEILPLVTLGAALFNTLIGIIVFFMAAVVMKVPVYLASLFLPIIILPFAFMVLGLMWFLASLGTYLRDIGHAVGLAVMVAMFLSPLFYPSGVLPAELRPVIAFNPLTFPMETARDAVLFGILPDPVHSAAYSAVALIVMAMGYSWFMATRRGFADVL